MNVFVYWITLDIFKLLYDMPSCFHEYFNFSSCNFKINMNTYSVKYLQGINCLQLPMAEKSEMKNFCCATLV